MPATSRCGRDNMETTRTGQQKLPAASTSRMTKNPTPAASKREQVPVACSRCRVQKVKVRYRPPPMSNHHLSHTNYSVMAYARRVLVASLAKHLAPTTWQLGLRDKSRSNARMNPSKRRINNCAQSLIPCVPDRQVMSLR